MGSSLKLVFLVSIALLLSDSVALADDELPQPGPVLAPSHAGHGKYHLRLLERGVLFKNRPLRNGDEGGVREMGRIVPINSQPRVIEVVDFPMDDGDVFDGNSKRFDDYGHSRFGKRNNFDDYGHSRFG